MIFNVSNNITRNYLKYKIKSLLKQIYNLFRTRHIDVIYVLVVIIVRIAIARIIMGIWMETIDWAVNEWIVNPMPIHFLTLTSFNFNSYF